jgi:hypothetical protein
VVIALATLSLDYYFIPPAGSLTLRKPELPYLVEFALPALLTCWFVKKRKIAEMALRRSRDEFESKVQERQAELARVSRTCGAERDRWSSGGPADDRHQNRAECAVAQPRQYSPGFGTSLRTRAADSSKSMSATLRG